MSPEAAALVRATWAQLQPDVDAVTADFYARLFARDPEARALFAHVDMPAQRRKFAHTLGAMIRVLDDPGVLVSESVPSGRRHAGYGVRARDYATVGVALLQALEQALGAAWTPAVRDAWRELYDLLAAVMRRAGERAPRAGTPA